MNRLAVGTLAVVVAAGAVGGFFVVRERMARQARLDRVLEDARLELSADEPERAELARLVRETTAMLESGNFDRVPLLRTRAKLRFTLGNADDDARADVQSALLALGRTPERGFLLLAARINARIHASVTGRDEDGRQALERARQVVDRDPADPVGQDAAMLGWVVAYRLGDAVAWRRFGDLLVEHQPDRGGVFVQDLGLILAGQLVLRSGFAQSPDGFEAATASSDEQAHAAGEIARRFLDAGAPTLATVERLEPEGLPVAPEVDFAIGFLRTNRIVEQGLTSATEGPVAQASKEIGRSLQAFPRSVGARHTRMVLHLITGETAAARRQATWLLENAPGADFRREQWARIAGG